MPDEELETAELKEQIDQRVEDHEHHAHAHARPEPLPGWLRYLSLSTAMIAVFAAVASLESGSNSNEAILEKSEAMLNQSQASDQWAYYQAKGLKETLADGVAEIIGAGEPQRAADAGPDHTADARSQRIVKLKSEARRYRGEAEKIKDAASELEAKVKESNKRSEELMEHHHHFAIAVTLLQIAIALSAIAALTRRKPLWYLGMAVSAGGLAMFAWGFV